MSEQQEPGPGERVLHWERSGTGYPSALEVAEMIRDIGRWLERESPTWSLHPSTKRTQALKYRSPEEWRFRLAHPDEWRTPYPVRPSDGLYALGVFFYQLLTRRHPFEETEGAAAVDAILHRAPVPPRRHSPRVPEALEVLCLRLLEKTPERRVPSLEALCAELDALVARADDTWRVPLFTPRRRGVVPAWVGWSVTILVLMAVSGAAGWLRSAGSRPRGPPPEAVRVAPPPPEEEPPVPAETEEARARVRPLQPLPVLEELPSEDCPAGASEAMSALRIIVRPYAAALPEESAPDGQDITLTLEEPAGTLPFFTALSGRLHATPGRLHARLTRARTPSGEEHPVCLELREDRMRGAGWERGSTPQDIRLPQHQLVWPVERFE